MHRIEIKNFGPIKHFEADITDLMFFIGPQASGKSTISKIIFFCRRLHNALYFSFEDMTAKKLARFSRPIDIFFLSLKRLAHGFFSEIEGEFIYYINSQLYVRVQFSSDNIEIIVSESLETQLNPLLEEIKLFKQQTQTTIQYQEIHTAEQIFLANIETKLFELFEDDHFCMFIPAGRNGFAKQFSNIETADLTISGFLHVLQITKNLSSIPIEQWLEMEKRSGESFDISPELFKLAVEKVKSILKGEYRYHSQSMKELFVFDDKVIDFAHTSSGQQEVVWILYILLKLLLEDEDSSVFTVIEEPEAHLFPETQNQLIEFLGLFANAKPDNQLLVTTHSPYILTALNNLIYAYQVGQKNPDEVNALIAKQFWIDPRRVSAYFVENGTARSIMDEELQQIKAEEIDNASTRTNNIYDQLLDIKFNGETGEM